VQASYKKALRKFTLFKDGMRDAQTLLTVKTIRNDAPTSLTQLRFVAGI
jgi:hypothetical protein